MEPLTDNLDGISKVKQVMAIKVQLFTFLMVMTLASFIFLGLFGVFQSQLPRSPMSSMKALAPSISSQFFLDMMALEIPYLDSGKEISSFSPKNVNNFLFELVTNINPMDPKSVLAREIPGMANERTILLYGAETYNNDYPIDFPPPAEVFNNESIIPVPKDEQQDALLPEEEPSPVEQRNLTEDNRMVLIYHSHNRESWLPELKDVTDPDLAYDEEQNITLLGQRMTVKLQNLGLNVNHSTKDYPTTVNDFKYHKSYEYSKETVSEAVIAHPELKYLFDIHRDSQKRSKTTATINGKDYAQIYFVVGEKNPDWEKNMKFAKKIHDKLNEKLPGLSKGIYSKDTNGNGEYNQSFSPNSSLIEIGGVENTLEESYRTIDVLSEVIAELYWEAEKVTAPVSVKEIES
jgi:stage II sporulation protein P